MGGTKAQTPREKRLQSRAERTEKVQTKEGTTKATTQKLKGKTHLSKQTEIVETVSTGSLEMKQQKEKSP